VRSLLAAGAAAGLGLASAGILEPGLSRRDLPADAAAEVNGVVVRRARYERALSALARDRRQPLREQDRHFVLDRLIEEELLVQRAVDLGLDKSDPLVRNTLVSAMIETIVSGIGQHEPDTREVEAFYQENRDYFARVDRFWVRQLRFPIGSGAGAFASEQEALETAAEATHRLRGGERFAELAHELGSLSAVPLPDGLLPAAKLREYLGPSLALRATELPTGEISDPIRGDSAYYVLQMRERISSPPLALADVESQVRAEMRRRAGDESLRSYLERLREDASIRLPDS
jgi:parvulin-like peptidyl-prolyl isomerase